MPTHRARKEVARPYPGAVPEGDTIFRTATSLRAVLAGKPLTGFRATRVVAEKLETLLFTGGGALLTVFSRDYLEGFARPERFYVLLLYAVLGMTVLAASVGAFHDNWMSWFNLHVDRETGLVLFGHDPEPAGFIAAYVSPPIFGAEVYPLVGVIGLWWVDQAHRRHGVGQRLLQDAESWLRAGGMKVVETHYMTAARNADALWREAGYAPYFVAARKPLG